MSTSIRDTFFEECEDLLTALSNGLDQMTPDAIDTENMNAVFRAVHSMKGGGGAFGLDDLVSFAHTFETVLDQLRSNKLTMTPDILNVLLTSGDRLADLVAAARDGTSVDGRISMTQAYDDRGTRIEIRVPNSSVVATE